MITAKSLQEKSIDNALLAMVRRAAFAGPIQILAYWALVFSVAQLKSDRVYHFGFALLSALVCGRVILWFFGSKLLGRGAKRRLIWRIIFTSLTVPTGLVWGLTAADVVHKFGVSPITLAIIGGCMGVAAASSTAFAFDLVCNLAFQTVISLPMILVFFFELQDIRVPLGLCAFGLFSIFVAFSLFNFQIQILSSAEVIEQQKETLETAHRTLRVMLDSIDQAFLVFNLQGFCIADASEQNRSLLRGQSLGKSLGEVAQVPEADREKTAKWFEFLASDQFDFSDIAVRGPKELEFESGAVTLLLKYHPMRSETGQLLAVVLTATDVSRETKARKTAVVALERADLILRIYENKAGFRSFLFEFERVLNRMQDYSGLGLTDLRRDLHTIKGAAMLFGAQLLGKTVFETEIQIRELSDDKVSAVIAAGLSLRQSFLSWRNQEMGIFTQMGVFEDEGIEISRRRLADLSKRYAADPAKHAFLGELVQEMTMADFGDLMREFENHVVQVALKLGKKAQLQVVTTSEALRVPTNSYREVMRTFIHIFNNAIDHGIEPPDERVSHGKSEAGTIRVSYEQVTDKGMPFIKMQIVDDGRGINIAGIRAKLRGQGRSVENLSELEIAQHVFDDGLSTRDAVTAISGQGVGMGSVRSAILKIRGKIRVAKTDRHGTTFEILLPDRSVGAQKIDLPPSKAV